MTPARRSFESRQELAIALAEVVAGRLVAAIARDGVAALAVSGGSTPARFFAALGKRREVEWDKVLVTLVDERWVPETSERSNAGLVNEKLLQGPAAVARFVPLYSGGPHPDAAALERTRAQLSVLPPRFAAVVLGMGNDGHTASFFPGGDNLTAALEGDEAVLAIEAPGAGEPRITFGLARLLATEGLYLHIEGEEKARVLDQALADGPTEELPIRAVLRQTTTPLTIYWSA